MNIRVTFGTVQVHDLCGDNYLIETASYLVGILKRCSQLYFASDVQNAFRTVDHSRDAGKVYLLLHTN